MKNKIDIYNIERYIGIPYNVCDCWQLFGHIYKDLYDIDVPNANEICGGLMAKVNMGKEWIFKGRLLQEPADGCLVAAGRKRYIHHAGIYVNGGVIHTERKIGSLWEPLNRFKQRYSKVEFWDLYYEN